MKIKNSYIVLGIFILCVLVIIDNTFKNINNNYAQKNNCEIKKEDFDTTQNIPIVELYHAPWCGFSRQIYPIFTELNKNYGNGDTIPTTTVNPSPIRSEQVIQINDYNCDDKKNEKKCVSENIKGFPTIKIIKDNKTTDYNGPRTTAEILKACGITPAEAEKETVEN